MPMIQKNTWNNIQTRDLVHDKVKTLINTQQLPESKHTRGNYTNIKLLHKLYTQGKLFVDKDVLVLIKTPEGKINGAVISVPPTLFPGLVSALHLRFTHPSKGQLTDLISLYFYAPGWKAINDEVCDACHQRASIKKLPKILLDDTTTESSGLATKFSADVMERDNQKILIVREDISQFTRSLILMIKLRNRSCKPYSP